MIKNWFMVRRQFLSRVGLALGAAAAEGLRPTANAQADEAKASGSSVVIDPTPLCELSPYLNMQFMEPLGTTDSSVEAAWDYNDDDWRKDFVRVTRDLAPDMLRFGGLFS